MTKQSAENKRLLSVCLKYDICVTPSEVQGAWWKGRWKDYGIKRWGKACWGTSTCDMVCCNQEHAAAATACMEPGKKGAEGRQREGHGGRRRANWGEGVSEYEREMRESGVGGECGHSALYASKRLNMKIKAMRGEPTERDS